MSSLRRAIIRQLQSCVEMLDLNALSTFLCVMSTRVHVAGLPGPANVSGFQEEQKALQLFSFASGVCGEHLEKPGVDLDIYGGRDVFIGKKSNSDR